MIFWGWGVDDFKFEMDAEINFPSMLLTFKRLQSKLLRLCLYLKGKHCKKFLRWKLGFRLEKACIFATCFSSLQIET
jgi:hypothetical protein